MSRAGMREKWLEKVAVEARDVVTTFVEAGIQHESIENLAHLLEANPAALRPLPEWLRRSEPPGSWSSHTPEGPGVYWIGYLRSGGFWAADPTPVEILRLDHNDEIVLALVGSDVEYGLHDLPQNLWWSPRLRPYEVGEK